MQFSQNATPLKSTPLTPTEPIVPKKSRKKLWIFIIASIIVFLSAVTLYFYRLKTDNRTASLPGFSRERIPVNVSPTPFPFIELTVPYLRQKTYTSSLGERTQVSSNASYTSYLTSYTSEGLKINAQLTIPTGQEPEGGWPAIIFLHGYIPPQSYQTLENYASYVDSLARNEFVVFKIDLRGHGESEGEPGGGYYGSDYIVDTLNARAALQASDFVNPQEIGLWGHSMAGNIVSRSMAVKPEIPVGVIWAGAVYTYEDQQKYGINDSSFSPNQFSSQRLSRRRELFEKYGSPSAQSSFWQQVAPTSYLEDFQGALQLNHAVNDDVVDIGYSRDLVVLLEEAGVEHELHEYQSGGHNITGIAYNAAMSNTVDFFERYLKN